MDGRQNITCIKERFRRGLQAHLCAYAQNYKTQIVRECIVHHWSVVDWARAEKQSQA